jgi:methylated-DNA-[protein]-cysteine S-methyltransferase
VSLSRELVKSQVGSWVVEGDADGITRVYLPGERVRASGPPSATVRRAARQLSEYLEGRRRHFELDLHLVGTPFQQDVWRALGEIPYGQVASYGEVAAAVGRPNAYRAVGNANAANPWPIIVPCHRVVAAGGLGGYAGGLDVKRFLLHLEGVEVAG